MCFGKYTKTALPSSDTRLEGVLQFIHKDLCGPMSSTSLTGYEYYVRFIDDFSRKTWIYFLRSKTGKKIKVLRSNNEGEYTSHAFNEFCRQEGIKRQLTVPYIPQQNGVAERKNYSIVGAVRAMLHD